MQYVLAVDGGNTKTVALVANTDGIILSAARGGCTDIYNTPPDEEHHDTVSAALHHIEETVTKALYDAGISADELACSVFNMAGADWPEDITLLHNAMQARSFGHIIHVQNDALGVLYAATSDGIGVSVVCGTGACTGARAPDGRVWHSSTWQNQVGGGGHLGQKTLNAIYRAELGIEPPTSLTQRVLDFFQLNTVEEVLHLFTSRAIRPLKQVRYLAPILLDEAQAGDAVALTIVREHGRALGQYAQAAARRVGLEGTSFPLILAGGVFRHPSQLLPATIIDWVRTSSPSIRPIRCHLEPVAGVLLQALATLGKPINNIVRAHVASTLPPPSFFMTATATHEFPPPVHKERSFSKWGNSSRNR